MVRLGWPLTPALSPEGRGRKAGRVIVSADDAPRHATRRDVQRSCTSRALTFDLPGPRMRRRAGGDQARRGIGKDADSFSSGQDAPSKSPEPDRVPGGPQARRAPIPGGPFFGLLFFTPGILPFALRAGFAVHTRSCACVGKQRKVTRPPAGGRNARCVGGQIAVSLKPDTEALDPGLRRDDGSIETVPRAPTPHPNPLPEGEREQVKW